MSKALEFINQLNNVQIAFFVKDKLSTYLPATRNLLKRELAFRNFDFKSVDAIVTAHEYSFEKEGNGENCPRCHSTFNYETEVEVNGHSSRYAAFDPNAYRTDLEKQSLTNCMVCGYSDDVTFEKRDFRNLFSWFRKGNK